MMRWTLVTAVALSAAACKTEPPPTCDALSAHANGLYTADKAERGTDAEVDSNRVMLAMRASMCNTLSDDQKRCVMAANKLLDLEGCNLPEAKDAKTPIQK